MKPAILAKHVVLTPHSPRRLLPQARADRRSDLPGRHPPRLACSLGAAPQRPRARPRNWARNGASRTRRPATSWAGSGPATIGSSTLKIPGETRPAWLHLRRPSPPRVLQHRPRQGRDFRVRPDNRRARSARLRAPRRGRGRPRRLAAAPGLDRGGVRDRQAGAALPRPGAPRPAGVPRRRVARPPEPAGLALARRDALGRALRRRPHAGQLSPAHLGRSRGAPGVDAALRCEPLAARGRARADAADRLYEPRWRDDPRLPDRAGGRRAEEPAARAQPARRAVVPRFVGLQPGGPVPRQPGRGRAAGQLPRVNRLRKGVLGGELRPVGPRHAGRPDRRRALGGGAGDCRPRPRRDLRRQLRRLRDAGRHHEGAGAVCLRRELRRRVEHLHLARGVPARTGSRCAP